MTRSWFSTTYIAEVIISQVDVGPQIVIFILKGTYVEVLNELARSFRI